MIASTDRKQFRKLGNCISNFEEAMSSLWGIQAWMETLIGNGIDESSDATHLPNVVRSLECHLQEVLTGFGDCYRELYDNLDKQDKL